ncbi:unnamed protein product [Orchesella dallaii]|uniref:Odorant receptor n=1 Tax=Orchesella dallaii TaxID=48710 RepID=A0ABP1R713_9HEXA
MLPDYLDRLTEFRLLLMPIIGHGVFRWDKETRQLAKASNYLYFTWVGGLWASLMYCGLHAVTLYYKTKGWDRIEDVVEAVDDPQAFATMVLQWAEMIGATLLVVFIFLILDRREEIMFVMNQLLIYDRNLMDALKSKGLELSEEQKLELRRSKILLLSSSIGTVIAPMFVVFIVFHHLEPTHLLIEDILEVHMSLEDIFVRPGFYVMMLPPCFAGLYGGGNATYIVTQVVLWYYLVTKGALMDITPTEEQPAVVAGSRKKGLKLELEKYGYVQDDEIIRSYRTLQLFNCLMNEIFSSLAMAFHHVAILVCVCAMAYFAIKMNDAVGLSGYMILGGAMAMLLTVEYTECDKFGNLLDISGAFMVNGSRVAPRGSLFRKFIRSCPLFYVRAAHPFFTMDRMTFAGFWNEVVDKTITLLLW